MSVISGFTHFGGGNPIVSIMKVVAIAFLPVSTLLKTFDWVPRGELAYKARFGKEVRKRVRDKETGELLEWDKRPPKLYFPGLIIKWPWADKLHKAVVKKRTHRLEPQLRTIQAGLFEFVRVTVIFRVIRDEWGVFYALTEVENLDEYIVTLCQGHLQILVKDGTTDEDISDLLIAAMEQEALAVGVELLAVVVGPTNLTEAAQTGASLKAHGVGTGVIAIPLSNGLATHGNGADHNGVVAQTDGATG